MPQRPGQLQACFLVRSAFNEPGECCPQVVTLYLQSIQPLPLPGSPQIRIGPLRGLGAVPVWFVAWPQLEAALLDGSLTMPELEALSSLLEGSAGFYSETLHPDGGAKVPMINQVACGTLDDGRPFQLHSIFVTTGVMNVRIKFG